MLNSSRQDIYRDWKHMEDLFHTGIVKCFYNMPYHDR